MTKHDVLVDGKFLVRVLDEGRLAYVPIKCKIGRVVSFDPSDVRVIECETIGLVPLVEHGNALKALIRRQI